MLKQSANLLAASAKAGPEVTDHMHVCFRWSVKAEERGRGRRRVGRTDGRRTAEERPLHEPTGGSMEDRWGWGAPP